MKVKCPNCKKICHQTTDLYDPAKNLNGRMVEFTPEFAKIHPGWDKFSEGDTADMASHMTCPMCGAPLAPTGRLWLIEDVAYGKSLSDIIEKTVENVGKASKFTCPHPNCGKVCKSLAGLGAHMRFCKGKA